MKVITEDLLIDLSTYDEDGNNIVYIDDISHKLQEIDTLIFKNVIPMHWEKISEDEYHGFEWESDMSEETLRAVLICEDCGVGFKCDADRMDANLNYDEVMAIARKLFELSQELSENSK